MMGQEKEAAVEHGQGQGQGQFPASVGGTDSRTVYRKTRDDTNRKLERGSLSSRIYDAHHETDAGDQPCGRSSVCVSVDLQCIAFALHSAQCYNNMHVMELEIFPHSSCLVDMYEPVEHCPDWRASKGCGVAGRGRMCAKRAIPSTFGQAPQLSTNKMPRS